MEPEKVECETCGEEILDGFKGQRFCKPCYLLTVERNPMDPSVPVLLVVQIFLMAEEEINLDGYHAVTNREKERLDEPYRNGDRDIQPEAQLDFMALEGWITHNYRRDG